MSDFRTMERGGSVKAYIRERVMLTQRRDFDEKVENELKEKLENANPEDFLSDEEFGNGEISDIMLGFGNEINVETESKTGTQQSEKYPILVYVIHFHERIAKDLSLSKEDREFHKNWLIKLLNLYGLFWEEYKEDGDEQEQNGIFIKKPEKERAGRIKGFISGHTGLTDFGGLSLLKFILFRNLGLTTEEAQRNFNLLTRSSDFLNLSLAAKMKLKDIIELRNLRKKELGLKNPDKRYKR